MPPTLTSDARRELADIDPELLADLKREEASYDPNAYPKPEPELLLERHQDLKADFKALHDQIRTEREARFLKKAMPEKWSRELEIGPDQHVHSRLGHNMVGRIVALATQNPPRYQVSPVDGTDTSSNRAVKQTRWLNGLWPNISRGKALRRELLDNQCGDGIGWLEIYRTGAYDSVDSEKREGENTRSYMRRTDMALRRAGDPYAVRRVDPLAVVWDEDGNGEDPVCEAFIEELVPRGTLLRKLQRETDETVYEDFTGRYRGRPGIPKDSHGTRELTRPTCEVVRWYDRRWTALFVDGVLVGDIEEHGLGFVPMVRYDGMVTGSDKQTERFQGVFWGMSDLEAALDWLTTLEVDLAFTNSRPKLAVITPLTSNAAERHIPANKPGGEQVIDFSHGNVPVLRPGQEIVNVTAQFRAYDPGPLVQRLLNFITISGLNPIAMGESPGSDPAGYAINALQSAAQSHYEVLLDNASRGDTMLGNKLRRIVSQEDLPWYLSGLGRRSRKAEDAWIGLQPDDVDDARCESRIDPLGAINRIAVQQALRQGNKEGYIGRWRVQEAYGVEDYDMEDETILEDRLESELGAMAIEETKMLILEAAQGGPAQPQGPPGMPPGPGGVDMTTGPGGVPAPTNAPTVGGPAAGASGGAFDGQPGPAAQQSMTARAGNDMGRRPPGTAGAVVAP